MNSKSVTFTLFLLLAVLALFFKMIRHEPVQKEAFNRHPSHLYFTRHARCRMDCRHITEAAIHEIMQGGIINVNKSSPNDKPCPTYAIQGTTHEGESLRVIFGQCDDETKIITCYNLKEDFECHCPGDENKRRN